MLRNCFFHCNCNLENCEFCNEREDGNKIRTLKSDEIQQLELQPLQIVNQLSYHKSSQSREKQNDLSYAGTILCLSPISIYPYWQKQCPLVEQFQRICQEGYKSSQITPQIKDLHQNRGQFIDTQPQHNFQKHLKTTINSILEKLDQNQKLNAIERQFFSITAKKAHCDKQYWKLFFFGASDISLYEKQSLLQIVKTHGLQVIKQTQKSLKVKIIQYFHVNKNQILNNRKMKKKEKKKLFLSYLEKFFSQIQKGRIVKRINRN